MSMEIALMLRKVIDVFYRNKGEPYEVRILLNHYLLSPENHTYSIELKSSKKTCYFEDEESILLHIEGVLNR